MDTKNLTSLEYLSCEDAVIDLPGDLPARSANDEGSCALYQERVGGDSDGNHSNFSSGGDPKTALDEAKNENWRFYVLRNTGLTRVVYNSLA